MKQQPTHGYGIASTVCGLVSLIPFIGTVLTVILAIFAITFGVMQHNRHQDGFGIIGITLGGISIMLAIGQKIMFG